MSTDGDASSRMSSALDQIFARGGPRLPPRERRADADAWTDARDEARDADEPGDEPAGAARRGPIDATPDPADDHPGGAYALPEIVPATEARAAEALGAPAASSMSARSRAPAAAPAPTTAWGDHLGPVATRPDAALRSPGGRPRVRRVTRVVRHVDPWSTFKVALLFSAVGYVVALTSAVLLWRVADSTGTLANVERWFTQFGWETFEFDGGEIFRNAWVIGLFGAVALTGALVLLATLFNLVSDIIGGVRVTVLEEEVVERTLSSSRRYVVRRGPTPGADPGAGSARTTQDWAVDDDPPADGPPPPPGEPPLGVPATPVADWSVEHNDHHHDDDHHDDHHDEHDGAGAPRAVDELAPGTTDADAAVTADWSVDDEPARPGG